MQIVDLNYQRMIIAYHGCDASVVTKVLSGGDALAPSEQECSAARKSLKWEAD
jgi:hypothetical protein